MRQIFTSFILLVSCFTGSVQASNNDSHAICINPTQDGFAAYILNLDSDDQALILKANRKTVNASNNKCTAKSGYIYCGFKVEKIGFHNIDELYIDINMTKSFKLEGTSMSAHPALWHNGRREAVGTPGSCFVHTGTIQETVNTAFSILSQMQNVK